LDIRVGRRDRRYRQDDQTQASGDYRGEPSHGTSSLTLAPESSLARC
jgi:hypothetical protein